MESTAILAEVKEVLIIDLCQHVHNIDAVFGEQLIAPPAGVYILNNLEPTIRPNEVCYTASSYKRNEPIQALDNVNEAILNDHGEVIIPAMMMRQKQKFLKTAPRFSKVAMDVMEWMVREYVDSILVYVDPYDYESQVRQFFKPEFQHIELPAIEVHMRRILCDVSMFMGADNWNIYRFKRSGTDLIIEKGADWRVYDWMCEHERKSIPTPETDE